MKKLLIILSLGFFISACEIPEDGSGNAADGGGMCRVSNWMTGQWWEACLNPF